MDKIKEILSKLKHMGCSGIKISFEDEGALYNEIISMRNLTSQLGIELSVKIGGCEAKRDIIDCIDLGADTIVAPMVESSFSLQKFLKSLQCYNYNGKKGFNLETITSYNNLNDLSTYFNKLDFVTVGRVDFVSSLNRDRNYVDTDVMLENVKNVFKKCREEGTMCYLGGAISISSREFIHTLIKEKLLDKFETRYIIYDVHKIDFNDFEKLLYWGNVFEVEWLQYISNRYSVHANKDTKRIEMISERIKNNKIN
jgi:hypothetical protein